MFPRPRGLLRGWGGGGRCLSPCPHVAHTCVCVCVCVCVCAASHLLSSRWESKSELISLFTQRSPPCRAGPEGGSVAWWVSTQAGIHHSPALSPTPGGIWPPPRCGRRGQATMKVKCLAQHLAHAQRSDQTGSCCHYWRLWSSLGSEKIRPPGRRPLSSPSQQTLKPQMTKPRSPQHFLPFLLREHRGPETRLTCTRRVCSKGRLILWPRTTAQRPKALKLPCLLLV